MSFSDASNISCNFLVFGCSVSKATKSTAAGVPKAMYAFIQSIETLGFANKHV